MSARRWAELGLCYSAAVWGSTFYVVRDTVRTVDPMVLVGYRFLLAALLMVPLVVLRRRKVTLSQLGQGAVLAGLLGTSYLTQTQGLVYTSAANSGFLTGLFVLFVPLFQLLFSENPSGAAARARARSQSSGCGS